MKTTKCNSALSLALILALTAAPLLAPGCAASPALNDPASIRTGLKLKRSDRLLIVAPHPDDETLSLAGLIQQALKLKVPVKVIMMTNGDGYKRAAAIDTKDLLPTYADFLKLGNDRHKETVAAMGKLSLARKNIEFLCYPDGGVDGLFTKNWDYDNVRLGRNGAMAAPYIFAYEKQAPYCGQNVVKNLQSIISDFKPTIIVFPGAEDIHHDHWATNAFIEYTITLMRYRCRAFTYLVHRGNTWPQPTFLSLKDYLIPPLALTDSDAHWFKVPLTTSEESKKLKAVACYKSQLKLTSGYLESFVRRNELVAVYPDIFIEPLKKEPDFFTHPLLHGRIMVDPSGDTFLNELAEFGDIRGLGFAYNKRKIWFVVDTQAGIHKSVTYAFHMRIFKNDSIERLDLRVVDGLPSFQKYAGNSLNPKYSTRIRMNKTRLVVELPDDYLKGAEYVMVNVDTYIVGGNDAKWLDRTGWRRIVLDT